MRLRRIAIRNFRNLRDVTITATNPTVIVGENNAGKSNFLYALRLLFDVNAERLRLDLSPADICSLAAKAGETWFSITVEIGDLQKHVELEACFKERLSADGAETFVTVEGKYCEDENGDYVFQYHVLPPAGRFNEAILVSRRMANSLPLYFLDAVRDATRDTRATGRGVMAQLLSDVSYSDVEDEVRTYLKSANAALNKGQQIAQLAEGITRHLTPLVPGRLSNLRLAVASDDTASITQNLRLNIAATPDAPDSDIVREGTGMQNLALVAMFKHKVERVPTGVPILAVEEPEAHLHPHAQRRLFRDLANVDSPILLTTHSAEIVRHVDPRHLILFRSSAEQGVRPYQLKANKLDPESLRKLQQLTRIGGADLFFARSIIVVEGASECIALPAFAESLGCDLDRDGVSIVEASGNDFAFIIESCAPDGFFIPTVITYDTDALKASPNLVRQACKAGLINQAELEACRPANNHVEVKRKATLDKIGWIGAVECFEEEAFRAGYDNVILGVIAQEGQTEALQNYLAQKALKEDASGVASFIKKHDRPSLKIPIAQAIAVAVLGNGKVPMCYAKAIRKAMLLAFGGIQTDDRFEQRVFAAGFGCILSDLIASRGFTPNLQQFMVQIGESNVQWATPRFYEETPEGQSLRSEAINAVASAVKLCDCTEYAEALSASKA